MGEGAAEWKGCNMNVYRVSIRGSNGPAFDKSEEASAEVLSLLLEGDVGEQVTVDVLEMTKKTYDALPEFEGY